MEKIGLVNQIAVFALFLTIPWGHWVPLPREQEQDLWGSRDQGSPRVSRGFGHREKVRQLPRRPSHHLGVYEFRDKKGMERDREGK